jgi:hypothetical protein
MHPGLGLFGLKIAMFMRSESIDATIYIGSLSERRKNERKCSNSEGQPF